MAEPIGRGVKENYYDYKERGGLEKTVWSVLDAHRARGRALERSDINQRIELADAIVRALNER